MHITKLTHISIHTPAKGVTARSSTVCLTMHNFNPHPREGGDRIRPGDCLQGTDFNPHPREGGDENSNEIPLSFCISIHTPAKGVTYWSLCCLRYHVHFNPHPREGGDPGTGKTVRDGGISIHTPAKGVTRVHMIFRGRPCHFNPHPREGGDRNGTGK